MDYDCLYHLTSNSDKEVKFEFDPAFNTWYKK